MHLITRVPLMAPASQVGLRNRLLFIADQLGIAPLEAVRVTVMASEVARLLMLHKVQGRLAIGVEGDALRLDFSPWVPTWPVPSFLDELPYGCRRHASRLELYCPLSHARADAVRCREIASLLPLHVVPSRAELEMLAKRDALTGLYNRHALQEQLSAELARAIRYQYPLSLMMLDIDHFKQINDTHGHPAGDACLRKVAGLLLSSCREQDFAARFGGEEFVVILPHTDVEDAMHCAERLRLQVEQSELRYGKSTFRCSVSIGVAGLSEERSQPEALIEAADGALYQAKRTGRNRVCRAA